jgi:hypothetical protein
VRKALAGRGNKYSKVHGGRRFDILEERKIVKLRRWEDYLGQSVQVGQATGGSTEVDGYSVEFGTEQMRTEKRHLHDGGCRLGNLSPSSTCTTLHKAKQAKSGQSTPPRPVKAQNYTGCTSVVERHLDFRDQGRHKYGGGAMIMNYVPEHYRRTVGPRTLIDGVQVRIAS